MLKKLIAYMPVKTYKFPWDDDYWKIIYQVPFTNKQIIWSHYAKGWFGLRIQDK